MRARARARVRARVRARARARCLREAALLEAAEHQVDQPGEAIY